MRSLQISTIQMESTVRFGGGTVIPRSVISFRISADVSGLAIADLHANAHETIRVIQRLKCMPGKNRTKILGIATAAVARIELRTVVDEELNDFVSAFERRPHQGRAAIMVGMIGIEAQI